jgi:hypothetical protein
MTRKSWMLIGLALVLAVVYAVFFANWFKPGIIRIYHLRRPTGFAMRTRRDAPVPPLTFGLEGSFKLTEIEAVPLAEWQTNRHVLPVWHLISDSNSVPVQSFIYGQGIRGMKPAMPGAKPQPLQANVVYRLLVTAGKARGQHDFEMDGNLPGTK